MFTFKVICKTPVD